MTNNIKFIDETHSYYVKLPSVSELLSKCVFPNKYKNVPKDRLKNAAQFGIDLHEAIEKQSDIMLCELGQQKYQEYLELSKQFNLKVLSAEKAVYYKNLYAGTYDQLCDMLGAIVLVDIKATYNLDKDWLSYQLSFYAMAIEWLLNIKIDSLWCMWLPKRKKGQFVKIDRLPNELLLTIIHRYYNEHLN